MPQQNTQTLAKTWLAYDSSTQDRLGKAWQIGKKLEIWSILGTKTEIANIKNFVK